MNTQYDINILLLSVINSEPSDSTNYLLASKILKNLDTLQDVSVQSLADLCNVSIATISRFCRMLNLSGFSELKYLINSYSRTPYYQFKQCGLDLESFSLEDFITASAERVLDLKNTLNMGIVDAIATQILACQDVVFAGVLQSGNSALSLQYLLTRMGVITRAVIRPAEQRKILEEAGADTFVLVFSKSGDIINKILPRYANDGRKHPKIGLVTHNEHFDQEKRIDYLLNLRSPNNIVTEEILFNAVTNLIALRCYILKSKQ